MENWPVLVRKLDVLSELLVISRPDTTAATFFMRLQLYNNPFIGRALTPPTVVELEGMKIKFNEDF